MAVLINEQICIGCSLCVMECPEEAIAARSVAQIDQEVCVECLQCLDACPADAIEEVTS